MPGPGTAEEISLPTVTRRMAIGITATLFAAPRLSAAAAADPVIGDIVFGRPDGAVRVVAYLSPTCPHSARFVQTALPALLAGPVGDGAMTLVWRDAYLASRDLQAAAAMRAAGTAAFVSLATGVFAAQAAWRDREDPATALCALAGAARGTVEAALGSSDLMRALLAEFRRAGGADGICASPTFLAGNRRHTGYLPAEALAALAGAAQSSSLRTVPRRSASPA